MRLETENWTNNASANLYPTSPSDLPLTFLGNQNINTSGKTLSPLPFPASKLVTSLNYDQDFQNSDPGSQDFLFQKSEISQICQKQSFKTQFSRWWSGFRRKEKKTLRKNTEIHVSYPDDYYQETTSHLKKQKIKVAADNLKDETFVSPPITFIHALTKKRGIPGIPSLCFTSLLQDIKTVSIRHERPEMVVIESWCLLIPSFCCHSAPFPRAYSPYTCRRTIAQLPCYQLARQQES
ncbi:hypothetical protein GQR58_010478 [Nymphon striatum]|nr:hypothetical protein GQR58_010478 [Nymphon striatum]